MSQAKTKPSETRPFLTFSSLDEGRRYLKTHGWEDLGALKGFRNGTRYLFGNHGIAEVILERCGSQVRATFLTA